MRFVGHNEIAAFLARWPGYGPPVRAWVFEVKHRHWDSAAALEADFGHVDISALPIVIFHLQPITLRINTVIDFRRGIVLLTAIKQIALAA